MALGLIALAVLYIVGARAAVRANRRAWPLIIYPSLYVIGLSIGNPVLFVWYYPPLMLWIDLFCLLGLVTWIARYSLPKLRRAFIYGSAGVLLLLQWQGVRTWQHEWPVSFRQRELVYLQAAATLQDSIGSGYRVALPEIGVLGDAFEQDYIIDTVGLVSPEAIPLYLFTASGLNFGRLSTAKECYCQRAG